MTLATLPPRPPPATVPAHAVIAASEADARYAVCLACPELLLPRQIGEKCRAMAVAGHGCSGRHRSRLRKVRCPLGKWPAATAAKQETVDQ
jgi:hypothetical protein